MEELDVAAAADFLVLLREGHVGRAAERRALSPSALGKRISRLERQVGAPLLVRRGGGPVEPTDAGIRFAAAARRVLVATAEARRAATGGSPGNGPRGGPGRVVRLGVPGGASLREHLVALAGTVRGRFPGARLSYVPLPFQTAATALVENRVDVLSTVGATECPGVASHCISACARVGIVAAGHELAGEPGIPAEDFARYPMLFTQGCTPAFLTTWTLGDVRPARDARLMRSGVDSLGAAFRQVGGSRSGVTVLPSHRAVSLPPGLRAVALTDAPEVFYYAERRADDRREAVDALVDALRVFHGRSGG